MEPQHHQQGRASGDRSPHRGGSSTNVAGWTTGGPAVGTSSDELRFCSPCSISLDSVSSEGSTGTGSSFHEMMEQEDILNLTQEVRGFKEALGKLRRAFMNVAEKTDHVSQSSFVQAASAHDKLGEVLRILRSILEKYPPLQSSELIMAAAALIQHVKGLRKENEPYDSAEFFELIDQLALSFSNRMSEYLMGDLDSVSSMTGGSTKTGSSEYLASLDMEGASVGSTGEETKDDEWTDEKADAVLLKLEQGVEYSLHRAKVWSKYAKDVTSYVEKRAALEMEYAKNLNKLARNVRPTLNEESFLPFQSIFCAALDHDIENSRVTQSTCEVLQGQKFVEPLLSRRLEHERCRKLLKEVWHREVKRMQEAVSSMRKAKTAYHQRLDEYQKSPLGSRHSRGTSSASASDVDPDFKSSDQRRKTKSEEDVHQKLLEAELNHKALVENANEQHTALLKTKAQVLQQIHELIIQCDQTMKTVTVNYFQLQHSVTAPSPIQFQTLCESSRLYEPGSQYLEFVKRLPGALNPEGVEGEPQKSFTPSWLETYLEDCPGPTSEQEGNIQFSQLSRDRKSMDSQASSDGSLNPIPSDGKGARARAWTTTGHCSDTDSSLSTSSQSTGAGRSYNASPTALKAHGGSSRAEAACSEPLDSSGSFDSQVENGGGGGRGNSGEKQMFLGMSKAAETHRFKKLRTPSRCRECDSYVYFQGAECCECGLASHKKCLKTLALRCGHKRLPRKMTTFGVEIGHHMSETSVSIPPLIAKCVSEIDKRGLKVKGIYRVSGVKSRVEKLCQSFENGPELVDLTEVHPNIIANVLKLYLRQLPEPLLPAYLYNDFIRIAAEYPENDEEADSPRALRAINSMRDIAAKLPKVHRDTLSFLMHHLTRVAAEAPANNMPSSNLGIVFGPTLLRSGDGNPSLNTLIDTCFQTRAIEILIVHATYIFGRPPQLPKEYYGDSAVIPESSAKPHSIPRQDSGSDSGFLSRVPLMRSLSSLGTPPPNAGKTKTGEAPHPAASNSGRDAQNKEPLRSASKNFLHQHLALGSHHSEDLDEIAPDKSQPIVMLQAVEDSRKKTTGYSQSLSFESPSSQHLQPDHSHNPRKDALKKCLSDMTAIAGIEIEPPQPPPRLEKPSKSDSGPAVVGSKPFRKSLSGPTLSGESALVGLMRSQTSPSRRTRPQVPLAAMAEAVAGVDASPTDYQHKQPSKPGNKHSASGTGSGASVPSVSESDGSTGSLFSPRPSKIRTAMDFRPQLHKHAFEPESSPSRSSKASDK